MVQQSIGSVYQSVQYLCGSVYPSAQGVLSPVQRVLPPLYTWWDGGIPMCREGIQVVYRWCIPPYSPTLWVYVLGMWEHMWARCAPVWIPCILSNSPCIGGAHTVLEVVSGGGAHLHWRHWWVLWNPQYGIQGIMVGVSGPHHPI